MTATTPSAKGRPTKAQAQALTEALLDTARLIFSRKGFAATSLDEIAASLHASKHTIYRRYPNKLELLGAVIDRDVKTFVATLKDAGTELTGARERLRARAYAYFRFGLDREYTALYATVLLEAETNLALRSRLLLWAELALGPLREAISQAFPSVDARAASELLVDLLDGAASRARWEGPPPTSGARDFEVIFAARWSWFLQSMS